AEAVADLDGVADVAVAADGPRRARLWRYREAHTEAINLIGPPHKLDVALPLAHLAEFAAEVPAAVARVAPSARTWVFGHAADGNLHVNVTGVAPGDDAVDEAVVRLTLAMGGSTGAEHGVGTAKRRWLALDRSPADLAAMRAVKAALDPAGILNPNVLLP
ncbi:MAG TPA: FAD-linked oxidase C-terminal domain-containing protein, partial [Acidimicrobiales bacterium]